MNNVFHLVSWDDTKGKHICTKLITDATFLQDPIDEMASLDNDAYLNSLEQYMVNTTWPTGRSSTPNTNL